MATVDSTILKGSQYKKTGDNTIQKVHLETDSDQVLITNTSPAPSGSLTEYLRNLPDNNTTYTFAGGTDGFTVTPSGGSAQTVTITTNLAGNNLSGELPVSKGGTGATSAANARTNLGLGTAAVADTGTSSGNVPVLDSTGKLNTSVLPDYLLGQLMFGGTFVKTTGETNPTVDRISVTASTNLLSKLGLSGVTTITVRMGNANVTSGSTTIYGASALEGVYFLSADTTNHSLTGRDTSTESSYTISDLQVGDWLVSNGNTFTKVDNTDAVTSVNGNVGAVTLTASDVGALPSSTNYVGDVSDGLFDLSLSGTGSKTLSVGAYGSAGAGHFYTGTSNPSNTNRLNYDGNFYATNLYSGGNKVITEAGISVGSSINAASMAFHVVAGTSGGSVTLPQSYLEVSTGGSSTAQYNPNGIKFGSNWLGFPNAAGTFATQEWVNNKGYYTKPSGGIPSSDLATSGVTAGTYSAVTVNDKGLVTVGALSIKYVSSTSADISDVAIGGTVFVVS